MSTQSQRKLHVLFNRQQIETAIKELAKQISRDYSNKHPILIVVLKGSFIFAADLIRQLDFPLEVDFVKISSYGAATESSGKVKITQDLSTDLRNRHLLVIEDIVDTGRTLSSLLDYLRKQEPASLKLCALADKPARRQMPVSIDYLGFTVPNKFIVGYGVDWDEKFRYLPDICTLEEEKKYGT